MAIKTAVADNGIPADRFLAASTARADSGLPT